MEKFMIFPLIPISTLVTSTPETFDLVGITNSVIAGVFTILAVVIPMMIQARMKDKQAAEVLSNAIRNSLGAIQQAATVQAIGPHVSIITSPNVGIGVEYVLDHAGDEAIRLGVSREQIAEKIKAKIGLLNIESNIATAGSPAPSPHPLASIPTVPEKGIKC